MSLLDILIVILILGVAYWLLGAVGFIIALILLLLFFFGRGRW